MEQAFIHRNTPAVRRPPERHQNDQMAAAALLQDIDNGTGAVHWYSAQRRMEEGRIGSEEHRVRPKCSVRCVVEMAVWLPVMMIQTSSVLMGSNYYNQCPRNGSILHTSFIRSCIGRILQCGTLCLWYFLECIYNLLSSYRNSFIDLHSRKTSLSTNPKRHSGVSTKGGHATEQ
ncbi:uncharacterized protein LOC129957434 isoform X3 [Argiope bruennichi]|uniref:uncharacterized protein LOC129957434 isoform X3 n=1 Tax=Argiope bruennichi TaxID=94029 RepID=UPI002494199B|nr:uncharacterized protein LOC129957434 isoform X3 [Argiope bruennichi]